MRRKAPALVQLPPSYAYAASAPPSAPSPRLSPPPLCTAEDFSWRPQRHWSTGATLTAHELTGVGGHLLTFELDVEHALVMTGQHVILAMHADGESRQFTPIHATHRIVIILVKVSPASAEQPTRGAFARSLVELPVGSRVHVRGPFGACSLDVRMTLSRSDAVLRLPKSDDTLPVRRLALVAGGSGVTPIAQILHAACAAAAAAAEAATASFTNSGARASEPHPLELWVLLSDKSPSQALLRSELDDLQRHDARLRITIHRTYTACADASLGDGTSARRIDETMLRNALPLPAADTAVLVAGPSGFENAVGDMLASVGHVHTVLLSSGQVRSPLSRMSAKTAAPAAGAHAHALTPPGLPGTMAPWLASLRCCVASGSAEAPHLRVDALRAGDDLFCA